jgi:hypothetical protein
VITLSNMEPELEEWARAEAERSKKPFYQVVNEALELAKERAEKDEPGGTGQSLALPGIRGD